MTVVAEVAAPQLEARSNGVWDYISASRLNLWLRCPLAFKLRYIDGVPTRASQSMFFGKQVHSALEFFYRHWQLGLWLDSIEVTERLENSWFEQATLEGVPFASDDQSEQLKQKAIRLIEHYLEQLPPNEPRPLAVETTMEAPLVDPVTGEDLGIPLVGILDLVVPTDTGAVVCDFKTAATTAVPLEISHEVQLGCYAYLFRELAGQRESQLEIRSLIKTKAPQVATHRYQQRTDAHLRRLFAVIRAYLDDLDSGQFLYRPTLNCSMCTFRDCYTS